MSQVTVIQVGQMEEFSIGWPQTPLKGKRWQLKAESFLKRILETNVGAGDQRGGMIEEAIDFPLS